MSLRLQARSSLPTPELVVEGEPNVKNLTLREALLTSNITAAGRKGDWPAVSRLWDNYTGAALPVYSAVMSAACSCGRYEYAAQVYDKLVSLSSFELNRVIVRLGLKIFGKLREQDKVAQIWSQAEKHHWIDALMAGSRLHADAEAGNLIGAAKTLDYMCKLSLDVGRHHFTSAIKACQNSNEKERDKVAAYFWRQMIEKGLQPDVVTFTHLASAHKASPIARVKPVYSAMKKFQVKPDSVFAETYLIAVLGAGFPRCYRVGDVVEATAGTGSERLKEVRKVLADFHAAGIKTKFSSILEEGISQRKS